MTTHEESVPPDPYGLVERLNHEINLPVETARVIAEAVIAQLDQDATLPRTPAVLYALTNAQLQAAQLSEAQRLHTQLGISFANVDQLIQAAPIYSLRRVAGTRSFRPAAAGEA